MYMYEQYPSVVECCWQLRRGELLQPTGLRFLSQLHRHRPVSAPTSNVVTWAAWPWTHGLGAGQGWKSCFFFFHGFCSKLVGHWSVNRLIRYGLIEYIWILLNIHPPEMTAPLGDHSTNIEWLLVISNKWHQILIFQPSWVDYTSRSSRSIFHSLFK